MDINNILFLSPHDSKGGASRIANYLFYGLRDVNIETQFYVGKKSLSDSNIYQADHFKNIYEKLIGKIIKRINYELGYENFYFPETKNIFDKKYNKTNLVHFHNPQGGYFDLRFLPKLSHNIPTLFTLHDPWMFTGHCSYFIECDKWKDKCGNCPDLSRRPSLKRDGTAFNLNRKKNIYAKSKLYIATPSQWLMDECDKSILSEGIRIKRVINNGVDTTNFKLSDKNKIRNELDLDNKSFILLYVVSSNMINNPYKDYNTVNKAIEKIAYSLPDDIKVTFLGLGHSKKDEKIGNVTKKFIPFQTDMKVIASYFQASDIYLHAARAENFPNVVLEAMACGTPVIATKVGGVPEQIIENKNGWIVPYEGYIEMSNKILELIKNRSKLKQVGLNANAIVKEKYTTNHMIDNYIEFYEEICEDFKKRKK